MKDIAYHILRFVLRALGALPLPFHYACGKFLSWLAGSVLRYRRDVVMINLARSFPGKKYGELKQICKQFYTRFGEILAEAVWFGGCSNPERLKKAGIVRMTNPEELNRLYENSGSVFVLASHSGNWELFGGFASYSPEVPLSVDEMDVCVVFKRLSSEVWDRVMQENRKTPIVDKEHYEGEIESMSIMRYMINHRDQKKVYAFITDQHPYKGASRIEVGEFMHQPTKSLDGAAKLAAKFGMSVAYLTMVPESRGHYKMTFTTICENASEMSPEDIMKKYYELLQKDIEATPCNYLWTHKRWKSK